MSDDKTMSDDATSDDKTIYVTMMFNDVQRIHV